MNRPRASTEQQATAQPKRVQLSRSKKILFGVILTLGFFALLEGALRLVGFERAAPIRFDFIGQAHREAQQSESIFRTHPDLFWELRPGFPDLVGRDVPNEHTLRGPAYSVDKPPGTFRVAVMGDSCTYGLGLALDQTYARRLEDLLSRAHRDRLVQVLNGGVHGYSIYQGRVALERKILPFDPDVVVLYFGAFNDGKFALGASDLARGRGAEGAGGSWTQWLDRGLRELRLYHALSAGVGAVLSGIDDPTNPKEVTNAWLSGRPTYGVRVPADEFESLLEEMLDLCEIGGARPLIVLPELNQDFIEKDWQGNWGTQHLRYLEIYRAILARVAAERDVITVDQREIYAPYEDSREIYCPEDPVHPNGQGNLILAWKLFETIESSGLVEVVPGASEPSGQRALGCDRVRVTPSERRVEWRLDAGPELSGCAYRLVASNHVKWFGWQSPEVRFPLEIDRLARYLLDHPDMAIVAGWYGTLDEQGRATVTVEIPERLFETLDAHFVGFAFVASRGRADVGDLRPGRDWVSNDVWLAVERPHQ